MGLGNSTFILKNDGTVYGTGYNDYGQLGLGNTNDKNTFTQVNTNAQNVKSIVCGNSYTFILKKDGTAYSVGYNRYGQLGLGDNTDKSTFTQVNIDNVKSTNDMIQPVLFLIKSLSKYYTIKDSTLTETTLTDFETDAIELDVVNDNI